MATKTEKLRVRENTLPHLLAGFYLSKEAEGCSPNTIIEYRKDFAHFGRWCGEADPTKLTSADIKAFLAWLRAQPNGRGAALSPKTVYNASVALRSFFRWLSEEAGVPNPMAGVPAPKVATAIVEPLSKEEVAAICKACDQTRNAATVRRAGFAMRRDTALRDKAIVLVLLDSGMRASELCALAVGDADLATGRVTVERGKGGKARHTYLGKAARKALWRYVSRRDARPDDPLFVTRGERAMDGDRLLKLLGNLGKRAGVANLHPHRFRHTFATQFLRNGGNLLALQRLLGHSNLGMVRRYAAIVEADLAAAHESSSPADRWRL